MMTLITGQPGHRKTVYALKLALDYKKQGRTVYANGVKDLDYDRIGFRHLEDPKAWQDLPDGSVVLLDECYTTFPNRNSGSKVPDHVGAMATHRHRGFDFILVAQQGLQLDPFLRGLYDVHYHCRKRWGKGPTRVHKWDRYQGSTQASCADVDTFIPPKELFSYYTSTVSDTTRWSVPKWAKYTLALLLIVIALGYFLKARYAGYMSKPTAAGESLPAASGAGERAAARPTAGTVSYADAKGYIVAFTPRIPTAPWTAPAYDGRPVTAEPEIFCLASEAGMRSDGEWGKPGCTCRTEQGTRYVPELPESVCRDLAKHGSPYNPFRRPRQQQVAQQSRVPDASPEPVAAASGIGTPGHRGSQARYGQMRSDPAGADPGLYGGD
ncbi:MAG: zonular occludens toxin [Pseudoxanthomonas suwonensis]|nr:MAG: zonular occludens toxin [Pseudoxanthomonas suwonensis]